jgi:Tol biopolymer transport system component
MSRALHPLLLLYFASISLSAQTSKPPLEVVYVSEASAMGDETRGFVMGIFKRPLNGGKEQRLAVQAREADVSRDGKHIAFLSTSQNQHPELFVMDVNGDNVRRVLPSPKGTSVLSVTWAPDATKLAFALSGKGVSGIYVVNADGSGMTKVDDARAADLAWSPDGKRLAFCSAADGREVMESSTAGIATAYGNWITWESVGVVEREVNLFVLNLETKSKTQLTKSSRKNLQPSWSPDGKTLAFASNRDGRYGIFLMNADDTKVEKFVSGNAWHTWHPSWAPAGDAIVFQINKANDERRKDAMVRNTSQVVMMTLEGKRTVIGTGTSPRLVPPN